jgi:hypothetical protein
MGQIIMQDKIGILSATSTTVTLAPSVLTIGARQFRTQTLTRTIATDVTLTANVTLYFIYAIVVSGTVQLRISTNVNSSGPSGFNSWKLVGAFYDSTGIDPAFVNIVGVPSTDIVNYTPTGAWTTAVNYLGRWRRVGDVAEYQVRVNCTGAPLPNVNLFVKLATGHLINESKVVTSLLQGHSVVNWGPAATGVVGINTLDLSELRPNQSVGSFSYNFITPNSPTSLANTNSVSINAVVPIQGWSNTPLIDL